MLLASFQGPCPRCGHGMENTGVACYMLDMRGFNRGSVVFTGRSIHNQRIERLWAELNRVVSFYTLWAELNRVVSVYYTDLFSVMKNEGILDSPNELHLFCLHYMYSPRVQRAAAEFRDQWNNHSLSTQGSQTPLQLWLRRVLNAEHFNLE